MFIKKWIIHNSVYLILALALGTASAISIKFEDEQRIANAISFEDCRKIKQVWIKAKCLEQVKWTEVNNCKNYLSQDEQAAQNCIQNIHYEPIRGARLSQIYFIAFTSFVVIFFFYFLKFGKSFFSRYLAYRESSIESFFDFLNTVSEYDTRLSTLQVLKRYFIFLFFFGLGTYIFYLRLR